MASGEVRRLVPASILVAAACGGSADVPPDAAPPQVNPAVELSVLDGYNHNSETSIAVQGSTVVVVSINQALISADSFEYPSSLLRRVAVYLSTDAGDTFAPPHDLAPELAETTDPVVRAAAGQFWISALFDATYVWRGPGAADAWTRLGDGVPIRDKEWIAPTPDGQQVFVMGIGGAFHIAAGGQVLGQHISDSSLEPDRNAVNAHVGSDGRARFLTFFPSVLVWDGIDPPSVDWELPPFDPDPELANVWTRAAGALGESPDGGRWIVRSLRDARGAPIVLHVRAAGSTEEQVVELTSPTGVAFLPTAAMGGDGRLHAAWYDASGAVGQLVYSHSVTADLLGDWTPPIVVDEHACPGNRWYPYSSTGTFQPGGRRLREYIDIAVEGERVHLTWTHAPEPPSRVRVVTIDLPP